VSGPSPWRRTPARAEDWFPAEVLAADRARRDHEQRVSRFRRFGWLTVLVAVVVADPIGVWVPDAWPEPVRVALAMVLIQVGLVVVELLAARRGGPSPRAATELATLAGALVIVLPVVWLGGRTGGWWLLVGVAGTSLLVLRARAGTPVAAVAGRPGPPALRRLVAEVADRLGTAPPDAVEVPGDVAAALLEGLGRHRRLIVTEAVEPEAAPTRRMVAHELVHHRRHHLEHQLGATVAALWIGLAAVAGLTADGRLWRALGIDDPWTGEGLALLVLTVLALMGLLRLPLAWLSRAHERSAELEAGRLVPWREDPAEQVALFVASGTPLDPPEPEWLWSPHPAPAERLALLRRVADDDATT
jgi:Zn-dependent protease with chaperone function